jgi:hypothetical protein
MRQRFSQHRETVIRRAGAGRRSWLARTPSAGRRCAGEAEDLGGFALSQAHESAELDKACADGIITLERFQSLVERE